MKSNGSGDNERTTLVALLATSKMEEGKMGNGPTGDKRG